VKVLDREGEVQDVLSDLWHKGKESAFERVVKASIIKRVFLLRERAESPIKVSLSFAFLKVLCMRSKGCN
jgi:hypothetical protein